VDGKAGLRQRRDRPPKEAHRPKKLQERAPAALHKPVSPSRDEEVAMIRKLKSGKYRLYSVKKNAKTGKRRNLGTFNTRAQAQKHERAVQYFKHHG
jgi:hypothetical protein